MSADAGTSTPGSVDAGTVTTGSLDGGVADYPEYIGFAPTEAGSSRAGCLYSSNQYERFVLEAYVTDPGDLHRCWVAWIGDTGGSIVFNIGAAWDEAEVFVKEAGDVSVPIWQPLGGVAQVGPNAGMNSFSLVIDPSTTNPMVATVRDESVHWDGSDVVVTRWDGQAWQATTFNGDTRLNATAHNPGFGGGSRVDAPRFSLDAEKHVVLTWKETTDSGWKTFQRTWDGTQWSEAVPVR